MKGPKESYCLLMDNKLMERHEEKASVIPYPLRPSSAGECSRKLAYNLSAHLGLTPHKPDNMKPNVLRLFKLGHHIEEAVIDELESLPEFSVRFKQQVVEMFELPSGKIIEGSTDAVMWNDEHKALLDVKSVGDGWSSHRGSRWDEMQWKYSRMKSAEQFADNAWWVEDPMAFIQELGEDPLVKNIYQLNLYACSPFLEKRGIDHVVVLRYQKNASKLMEIRFKPSPELFKYTHNKFSAIELAGSKGTPEKARKDYNLGSMACAYCPYQQDCWPGATKKQVFECFPQKDWAAKLGQLEKADELRQLFDDYLATDEPMDLRKRAEQNILNMLDAHGVEKVKLDSGDVFEVKRLQKGIELRRGKE